MTIDQCTVYDKKIITVILQDQVINANLNRRHRNLTISYTGWIMNVCTFFFLFSPMVQFQLLHQKFPLSTSSTKALLLSAYIKLINLFPEIKGAIQEVCVWNFILFFCKFICEVLNCIYDYMKHNGSFTWRM